jgi:hypothetical protein
MRVRAVKDFPVIIDGETHDIKKGTEFGLQISTVWALELFAAGLVVPVRERKIETAVREPQERAITR